LRSARRSCGPPLRSSLALIRPPGSSELRLRAARAAAAERGRGACSGHALASGVLLSWAADRGRARARRLLERRRCCCSSFSRPMTCSIGSGGGWAWPPGIAPPPSRSRPGVAVGDPRPAVASRETLTSRRTHSGAQSRHPGARLRTNYAPSLLPKPAELAAGRPRHTDRAANRVHRFASTFVGFRI
jgi:hypothetical protein